MCSKMLQVGSFEILIDQGVAIILNLDEKSPHANTVSWLEQENERGGKDREVYKKDGTSSTHMH